MERLLKSQKQELVYQYTSGKSVKQICEEAQISRSTMYYWIHQYNEVRSSSGEAITAKRLYLLEKRIDVLTSENEVWRKSKCTIVSPLPQKLQAIKLLYKEYGVHACCRVLKVPRGTFYNYLLRRPEKTLIQKEDEIFKPLINNIFSETKGRIGAKKIRALLMQQGYKITPERIRRLMKEMNLVCVSQKKHIAYNFSEKGKYYPNKLNRNFDQNEPDSVWVSDITRLYVNYKPYYLCVIIDLFSRKVISYTIGSNQEVMMVLDTFKKAYKNRNCPTDLMFHSDQGGQYVSCDFKRYLRKRRVKLSYSNPGCPYDNAVAESFFRTLKAEEASCRLYLTVDDLTASINEYIIFFNDKRPHQKLGYLTPNQVEERYNQKKE